MKHHSWLLYATTFVAITMSILSHPGDPFWPRAIVLAMTGLWWLFFFGQGALVPQVAKAKIVVFGSGAIGCMLLLTVFVVDKASFRGIKPVFGTRSEYPIPGHGKLSVMVPPGWQDKVESPSSDLPPTIVLVSPDEGVKVLITVLWNKNSTPVSLAQIREMTEASGNKLLPTSVEKVLTLEKLTGSSATGYYYTLQDQAPQPGEYAFITQGSALTGELILTYSILFKDKTSSAYAWAMRSIESADTNPDKDLLRK